MQLTKSSLKKSKCKRRAGRLITLMLLLAVQIMLNPVLAGAKTDESAPADTLELRVGYTGGDYTIVKTFSKSEMEAMADVQQAYSFIDNMPCPVIDSAVGVKLTDLAEACNINISEIKNFRFWTTDIAGTPYTTLTKTYLLDTPRYYFPHLADNWNADEGEINFPDPAAAAADAVQVPAILAVYDNWQREFTPLAPDFSVQDSSTRFRLVFGKANDLGTGIPEHTASKSAKWVYRMDVTLNGTAMAGVTLDKSSDTIAVGDTAQLTAVFVPADATNRSVTWSSDAPGIATVDGNGLVTAVGVGTANITVTTADGNKTATCAVTVEASQDAPVLAALTLGGSPSLRYTGMPVTYDLGGLTLLGKDQYGEDFGIPGYTVVWKVISGPASVSGSTLTVTGSGTVTVSAKTGGITSNSLEIAVAHALYAVTPVEDSAYRIDGTEDGIKAMTVKTGFSGFKYFKVQIEPVESHYGLETIVFVHVRNGIQLGLNAAKADFDTEAAVRTGFNVSPGDSILVYIVDQITNDGSINPIVLQ